MQKKTAPSAIQWAGWITNFPVIFIKSATFFCAGAHLLKKTPAPREATGILRLFLLFSKNIGQGHLWVVFWVLCLGCFFGGGLSLAWKAFPGIRGLEYMAFLAKDPSWRPFTTVSTGRGCDAWVLCPLFFYGNCFFLVIMGWARMMGLEGMAFWPI